MEECANYYMEIYLQDQLPRTRRRRRNAKRRQRNNAFDLFEVFHERANNIIHRMAVQTNMGTKTDNLCHGTCWIV